MKDEDAPNVDVAVVADENSTDRSGLFQMAGDVDGAAHSGVFAGGADLTQDGRAGIDPDPERWLPGCCFCRV